MAWALHNSLKGWTLYDLTDHEAQLIVKTLTANEMRLVNICKKGDSSWESLDQIKHAQLFKSSNSNANLNPIDDVDAAKQDLTQYPQLDSVQTSDSADTDYFVVKVKKNFFPRLHERVERSCEVKIEGANQIFTTQTIDLSEGGLHFVDMIPSWVAGYFVVNLQLDGIASMVSLMCSLVEDQKEKKRVQIMSEESDPQFVIFKDWLARLRV